MSAPYAPGLGGLVPSQTDIDMTDMLSRHTDHDDSNKEAKAAKPHMARMQHNKAGSKKVLFLLEGGNLARA